MSRNRQAIYKQDWIKGCNLTPYLCDTEWCWKEESCQTTIVTERKNFFDCWILMDRRDSIKKFRRLTASCHISNNPLSYATSMRENTSISIFWNFHFLFFSAEGSSRLNIFHLKCKFSATVSQTKAKWWSTSKKRMASLNSRVKKNP